MLRRRRSRQRERTVDDDLFTKRRRDDVIGIGKRREDVAGGMEPQRVEEKMVANERHTAAHHHDFRRDERHDLRDRPSQHLAGVVQNFVRQFVSLRRGLGDDFCRERIQIMFAPLAQIGRVNGVDQLGVPPQMRERP